MTTAEGSVRVVSPDMPYRWMWPTAGLVVAGGVVAAVRVMIGRLDPSRIGGQMWSSIAYLPLLVAGALIAALRPRSMLGWVLLVIATASELGRLQMATMDAAAPLDVPSAWLVWSGDVLWWLTFPLVPFVLLLVPNGRLPSRRWRPVAGGGAAMWILLGVAIAVKPGPLGGLSEQSSVISNPLGVDRLAGLLHVMGRVSQLGMLATLLLAVASLAMRWRNADGLVRHKLGWLCSPAAVGVAAIAVAFATGADHAAPSQIALFMFLVAMPAAICVTVLVDDLPKIDDLASRSFVFGTLTALLTGTYVLLVLAIGSLLPGASRTLGGIVATAAVAVLFAPARERVRAIADRHLFGETEDHTAAVIRLGQVLAHRGDTTVLPALVDSVADALAASYVEITTNDGTRVAHGTTVEPMLHRELVWAGDPVGHLAISLPAHAQRRAGMRPPMADLVDAVCPFVAAAIYALALVEEVQGSRAGIVEALEEERRRIRRDLHDGLGPALAGIGLGLETAENLAAIGSPDVQTRLRHLRDDVETVYDDLRHLARGLRPPSLDDLGLLAALQSQALRLAQGEDGPRICIRLDARSETLSALPAAVELAAYHITLEAITNVVRHARATTCDATLRRGPDLCLEIRDNGRGITTTSGGVGLHSMRERCEQLGGRIDLTQADGLGTIVTAWLPIR